MMVVLKGYMYTFINLLIVAVMKEAQVILVTAYTQVSLFTKLPKTCLVS